jgi:hypothetical protein
MGGLWSDIKLDTISKRIKVKAKRGITQVTRVPA